MPQSGQAVADKGCLHAGQGKIRCERDRSGQGRALGGTSGVDGLSVFRRELGASRLDGLSPCVLLRDRFLGSNGCSQRRISGRKAVFRRLVGPEPLDEVANGVDCGQHRVDDFRRQRLGGFVPLLKEVFHRVGQRRAAVQTDRSSRPFDAMADHQKRLEVADFLTDQQLAQAIERLFCLRDEQRQVFVRNIRVVGHILQRVVDRRFCCRSERA